MHYELNVEAVKRLQFKHGITDAQIAQKAEVSNRSVQRWLSQDVTPSLENLYRLATILNTTPRALIFSQNEMEFDRPIVTKIGIDLAGMVPAENAKALYRKVSDAVAKVLRECDIEPLMIQTTIASINQSPKVKAIGSNPCRTIILNNGILSESGEPFWAFVAVMPEQLNAYCEAYHSGKLDLQDFDAFGELIVSGTQWQDGLPPVMVIAQVAEMYQTPFSQLMKNLRDDSLLMRPVSHGMPADKPNWNQTHPQAEESQ